MQVVCCWLWAAILSEGMFCMTPQQQLLQYPQWSGHGHLRWSVAFFGFCTNVIKGGTEGLERPSAGADESVT